MLIDIHSHHGGRADQLTFIVGRHSLGIHPWEITKERNEEDIWPNFKKLEILLDSHVLALGECGLDRRRENLKGISTQIEVLKWHLDLATKRKLPVILHCVKAHSDLLGVLKSMRFKGRLLLHDFSGNKVEAAEYLKFDTYFSFGKRLLSQVKAQETLKSLPVGRLFFETDDEEDLDVKLLYQKASALKQLREGQLESQIEKNLLKFFSDLHNMSPPDIVNDLRFSVLE